MIVTPNNSLQRTGGLQWPHRARRGNVCAGRCGMGIVPAAELNR
jgi:hypothetical protein